MKRFLEFINENNNTMRLYYSDKLRTLFTKISNGSSEEAKKIANFLILAEDSNQMLDKYTLVDVTEKNDYISYVQVNRILKEFPGKEDRVENDSKFWSDEKIRTKHKIGKWVTHIYKDVYKTTSFTPSQIEEFSNAYKATYDAIDIVPEFVILKGDDIKWGYLEANYAEGKGTLANSCMRYDYCQKYFDIYTENEDVCSLLVLKDSNNKVKGRALLWVLDDGELYMDRIYIANDSDKYLFDEWAEEKNYRTYLNDHKSKSVDVEENSYDYYPYMDTFILFDTNNGVLRSNSDSDCIKLQSTTGGYEETGVWSDYAGEHIDEDYAVWIESIDDYVHQDDAVYLSYQDTYEIDDASYRSRRNLPALVHSECCETWLYVDDSSYSETLKDYVDISDGDYTTFIINKDGDEDIVPDGVKYTHLYKEVNDKNYSIDYIQNPYTGEYGFWDDIIYDIRNELVKDFGEDSTKVHGELVEKLLEFDKEEKEIPDEDFLTNIRENGMYNTILRTYYGFQGKPTPVEMLPAIYMGATLKIESEDTITYWPDDKYKNKLDYILNLIDDEELTNSYNTWTKSNSMMKDIIRFAYGFDYTIFNEDIYKRILYNQVFS
jgi:hypothetical protein